MKFVASSNLITDLKFKQQVGVKADAHIEALAVLNQQSDDKVQSSDLNISPETREELQINAKLFVKSFDCDVALEAVQQLKEALGVEKIDSLILSVPSEGIELIGIGAHSLDDDDEEDAKNPVNDPKRQEMKAQMINMWQCLTEKLQNQVTTIGLCDLETDIFFQLFDQSTIKPRNFQVNLKSCCVVPPDLQNFAKSNQIKLHTHADPPSVLGDEFMNGIKTGIEPRWIIRYQLFIKSRGVLQDKRYLIQQQ